MTGNQYNKFQNTKAEITNAALLESLKSGDHEAFRKIFIKYYNKINHFIEALVKSKADAEEITQEVFTNLWHKRERIDSNKNFNSYLYTQSRNAALNFIRAKSVRESYASESWHFEELSENADEILFAKETELLIQVTVSRMPKQRRAIYEMSRNKGLSNDEIAHELNITKNAVEKQLRSALKDIREVILLFTIIFIS